MKAIKRVILFGLIAVCNMACSVVGNMYHKFNFCGSGAFDVVSDEEFERIAIGDKVSAGRERFYPQLDILCKGWTVCLFRFERAVQSGDLGQAQEALAAVARYKDKIKASFPSGSRPYSQLMVQLEYSVVRLLQSDQWNVCLEHLFNGGGLEPLLSENDFKCATADGYAKSACTFRRMIVIAAALREYQRKHGGLPDKLSALALADADILDDAFGKPIEYMRKDDDWQLRSTEMPRPFGVYIPHLYFANPNVTARTREVCLSPEFSKKRKEWYDTGVLYEGTMYECELPNRWNPDAPRWTDPEASTPTPRVVTISTTAPNNRQVNVWYRMPKGTKANPMQKRRVLVIFGGRNCDGKAEVSDLLGWADWADRNDVVLVAPEFNGDEYWRPEKWSGAALLAALDEIGKAYPISTDRLLYYGCSGGSQASHDCGVFHEPSLRTRGMPGLVTCGDTLALARAFLTHYHLKHCSDLYRNDPMRRDESPAPFVGDELGGVFYPADSAQAANIPADNRVGLPSLAVASAWGKPGVRLYDRLNVDDVDFAVRVPSAYTPKSRVVVVIGERGWTGEETLTRGNFDATADERQCFLLSPSFTNGAHCNQEFAASTMLLGAVREVQEQYDLERSAPEFLKSARSY